MAIIYLHGFASSGTSPKVDAIRDAFPEQQVLAPNLPVCPVQAINHIFDLERAILAGNPQPVVYVGTSMGGLMAAYMALHRDNTQAVSVNPALGRDFHDNPGDRLIGKHTNYHTGEEFEWSQEHAARLKLITNAVYHVSLLKTFKSVDFCIAEDDDVTPNMHLVDYFLENDATVYITRDGGHRFEKHWNQVIDAIRWRLKKGDIAIAEDFPSK